MNILFSTDSNNVRTLENHRKAVEDFVLLLANNAAPRAEVKATYEQLLGELIYAEDEACDLDGSNKELGILYGFQPYEVENLQEELMNSWNTHNNND